MADTDQKRQAENIQAFKDGVASTAPKGVPYSVVLKQDGNPNIATAEVHDDPAKPSEIRLHKPDLTLREIFAEMAGVKPEHLKMEPPGNAAAYYFEIAEHEAGHMHSRYGAGNALGGENIADNKSYNGNNPAVEDAMRDTRKLSSLIHPDHATSPALPDKPGGEAQEKSAIKMHAAAQDFRDLVASDLMGRGKIGSPAELEGLQQNDPKAVYDTVSSLKRGGAFDAAEGSRGDFLRQYANDYMQAAEKWIKGVEPAPASTPAAKPAPAMAAPVM